MASTYNGPLRGLSVKHGFYKSVHKGEDAWSQKPAVKVPGSPSSGADEVTLDFFGVYDGHGGKQAAMYASRHLLDKLLGALPAADETKPTIKSEPSPELQNCKELDAGVWKAWEQQDNLVAGLPAALVQAFQRLQDEFYDHCKESGTTATVAVLAGWELLVANVGDSCAYLDTGSEVLQVSGNHRLDDSKSEQERIRGLGYEVTPSTVEGTPCGPLRVWPGGLAMSRTIGDLEAGEVVLCEPEVRQVTLPASGGRLIIASDGLWDAVAPKTAAHHIRGTPASKAARELVQAALKAKGLRDDITVLVIDALPTEEHKLPPQLMKNGGGQLQGAVAPVAPVNVYHPLEDGEVGKAAWRRLLWERRLEAVQAAFLSAFRTAEELRMMDSGAFSLESSRSTMMADSDAFTACNEEDADSEAGSQNSEFSETVLLGNNPFAIAGGDQFFGEDAEGDSWETVPAKSRAVPTQRGKKHALPPSDGSPSDTLQVPKALKEAEPSPAASPMHSLELGSLGSNAGNMAPRTSQPSRGNGRGGRGYRSAGRGRRYPVGAQQEPAPQHINGFKIRNDQPMAQTKPPPTGQAFSSGLSFLDGGGFSLQPMPVAGTVPSQGKKGLAVIEFTPAPRRNTGTVNSHRDRGRQSSAQSQEQGSVEAGTHNAGGRRARGRNSYRTRKPPADRGDGSAQQMPTGERTARGRGPRRGGGRGRGSAQREAYPVESLEKQHHL